MQFTLQNQQPSVAYSVEQAKCFPKLKNPLSRALNQLAGRNSPILHDRRLYCEPYFRTRALAAQLNLFPQLLDMHNRAAHSEFSTVTSRFHQKTALVWFPSSSHKPQDADLSACSRTGGPLLCVQGRYGKGNAVHQARHWADLCWKVFFFSLT